MTEQETDDEMLMAADAECRMQNETLSLSVLAAILQVNLGQPEFIEAKDDGGGDNWTTGAISCAKLQSDHYHQQTNIQFFTDWMPFLLTIQQCQSTLGKNITFHGLA